MKQRLVILVSLLPFLLRGQLMLYENRAAVATGSGIGSYLGYLTNGLVEWNKLNEPAGATIAADASGNGNTVPLIGSPTFNGNYLALNGSTQYGDANSNQLTAYDYGDLSICAWIKKTGSSQKGIVDKSWNIQGLGQGGWGFWILTNNYLDWWVENNEDLPDEGSQPVPLGQWTFVSVTWHHDAHEADFYINGLLTSKTVNGGASQQGSIFADLEIGNLQDNLSGGYYAFDGGIHDVAIYHRVLAAGEVATNFLNTVSSTNTIYPDLLYYEMTEHAQTNFPVLLKDSSTHSNTTGTVYFNPSTTLQWDPDPAGIPQSAIGFDGNTYIDTSNSTLFNFTTNLFTVNLWVSPALGNTYLMQNGIVRNSGWSIKLGGDYQVYFTTEANGVESAINTGADAANKGGYTMVTVARTGTSTASIYINGVQAATTGTISDPASSTNTLVIGSGHNGSLSFVGDLWLPQIWSQPLSAGAVAQLYLEQSFGYPWPGAVVINTNIITNTNGTGGGSTNTNTGGGTTNTNNGGGSTNCTTCSTNSGSVNSNATYITSGLVQWNKFNDNAGTNTAADSSGNNNILPLVNSPTLNGNYLTLNGTTQYGDAGSNQLTSLDFSDITICAWLNKSSSSFKGIVDKHFDQNNGNYGGWGFWVLANNHLDWWLEGNAQYIDAGGGVVTPGQWMFLTAVYHRAAHATDFYFNGILNSTTGSGAADQHASGPARLEVGNLGNNQSNGLYALDGSMQQLGIYNRALSAAEVKSNFQNSETTTNVSIPDLLYYKMTEYPNTTIPVYLADSSIHGGTPGYVKSGYTFQWITNQASIPNSAGHFNGVSTYIETSNSTLFNFTTNLFTINLWLCPLTANGFVMQNGYDGQSGYRMYVGGSYQLYFGAEGNGGESVVATGAGAVNVENYTMVTIVRSSTTQLAIYINGIQANTTGSFADPVSSASSLIFGANKNGSGWLDGNIWEPQIWSRPLTSVEVANLFFTQSAGAPWP